MAKTNKKSKPYKPERTHKTFIALREIVKIELKDHPLFSGTGEASKNPGACIAAIFYKMMESCDLVIAKNPPPNYTKISKVAIGIAFANQHPYRGGKIFQNKLAPAVVKAYADNGVFFLPKL